MLGVVVETDRVHLNTGTVSAGATADDGDRFLTEKGGVLLLRSDGTMLELAEESALSVRSRAERAPGTKTEPSEGSVVFRDAPGAPNNMVFAAVYDVVIGLVS